VVAADGNVCGYFGKREGEMVDRKRKLLADEQNCQNVEEQPIL
jgi:hypothetical protein